MELNEYQLDSIVEMKKPHPCVSKSKQFVVIRLGADIKIKCLGWRNPLAAKYSQKAADNPPPAESPIIVIGLPISNANL